MLKMLIADDEPVIIRGLQMLIDWAQLGIEICATCENGADALREIFAQSPDLALLDISMPGKTGIEILKALHTAQSRTKVIFISGFQDFSYAHDALSYGAVDYLLKPVKKDDLLRAVEKCLPVQPEHSAPAPASDTGSYYNGDGLDFDSCRHVWVRGCYIDGTDDNLCLQSSGLPVQDVHISDCAFTSVCVGIRIGLKSIGEISGVVISNCTMNRFPLLNPVTPV